MHCVSMSIATIVKRRDLDALCVLRSDSSIIGNSSIDNLFNLQVVDGPDSKCDSEGYTTKAEDENGGITSVEGGSNTVSDFLSIATTRSGALRASETWSLLFEIQTSALALEIESKHHFCIQRDQRGEIAFMV